MTTPLQEYPILPSLYLLLRCHLPISLHHETRKCTVRMHFAFLHPPHSRFCHRTSNPPPNLRVTAHCNSGSTPTMYNASSGSRSADNIRVSISGPYKVVWMRWLDCAVSALLSPSRRLSLPPRVI
jgi:hypothetical protein